MENIIYIDEASNIMFHRKLTDDELSELLGILTIIQATREKKKINGAD